jgi:hypothetical protein
MIHVMRGVVLALVLVTACSKPDHEAPPPGPKPLAPLPAGEIQRGVDACAAYVTKVCACTSADAQKACPLAKALPDALKLAVDTAADPSIERDSAMRAQVNIRETAKECIEQAARLPALGCP